MLTDPRVHRQARLAGWLVSSRDPPISTMPLLLSPQLLPGLALQKQATLPGFMWLLLQTQVLTPAEQARYQWSHLLALMSPSLKSTAVTELFV